MSMLFYIRGLRDFNEDISNWNVSNVTTMEGMFSGSKAFNQPIGEWNVSNCTNMEGMFQGSKAFKDGLKLIRDYVTHQKGDYQEPQPNRPHLKALPIFHGGAWVPFL